MRALITTHDFPPVHGGIQALVGGLVENLRRLEPHVVTFAAPGSEMVDEAIRGTVVRVPLWEGAWHRAAVARLNARGAGEALRGRPDVVFSSHVATAPGTALAAVMARAPMVQYLHAEECRLRPRLVRFALRRADVIIAVSGYSRDLALRFGAAPDSVHVVSPGVTLTPDGRERRARPTVVTVARLVDRYKGHDVLARALPLVRARVPDVEWVVVGDGPLRPWLEGLAEENGIADCARFVGAVDDRERDRWLRRAHVFAMPSRLPAAGFGGEGFGIVYLEAGAAGLPVVAGAAAGAVDAVADGETGRLVDPGDASDVAAAISDLLLDPALAERLGMEGRRRAGRHGWDVHAAAVEQLAIDAIDRRRRAA